MSAELLERPYTSEQELLEASDDGKEYELIRGELVEMQGPNREHGRIILKLGGRLEQFVEKNQAGEAITGSPFILDSRNKPRPDIAFTTKARLAGSSDTEPFAGAPDLAVEIVSRTDILFEVDDKVQLYFSFGTSLVWVINPNTRLVFVHHPNEVKPTILGIEDDLNGEDILPGFSFPVKALFEG